MKKAIFILLCFISFNIQARPLTASEKSAVENAIVDEMKDPDSAKFYHGDFPYPESTFTYCGYVNGKNSYGAYSGKQLFAVMIASSPNGKSDAISFDTNRQTGLPVDPDVLSAMCASAGYDIYVKNMFYSDVNKNRKGKGIPLLSDNYIRN